MIHYSNDARVNALFMDAECAGELDDCIHDLELLHDDERPDDDEINHLAGVFEGECEELAQETAPDAYLDADYEDRYAMYDDDPSPYAGDYSEM